MNGQNPERDTDPRTVYADIIDLPHWDSPVHPRMSAHERAAQFAPYAALVGYGDMVKEEARETCEWTEPGENETEELVRNLARISELLTAGIQPLCSITYFVPDERKEGGETVTVTETIRRIDPVRRRLILARRDGAAGGHPEIDLDRILRINGDYSEQYE